MDKKAIILAFEESASVLRKKMHSVSEDMFDLRPEYKDAWTIREHLIHLTDSDVNNFVRLKSVIGQPESDAFVIDEENWTPRISFVRESTQDYLELFCLLRKIMANFLALLPADLFDSPVFYRTYKGQKKGFTIKESVEMYTTHVYLHIEYIEKILITARK